MICASGLTMKKITIIEDGRTFEAFVKMLMIEDDCIIGMGIAGNFSSCRAIHASLYRNNSMVILDEKTGSRQEYRTTCSYRRIEVLNGKVCHAFFLPRSAVQEDFEQVLQEAEQNKEAKPERIIISPSNKITFEVGKFLATTYGLPRAEDWTSEYLSLLPKDKWNHIDVETTELMDDSGWEDIGAIRISSMSEKEVLSYIDKGTKQGILNVHSSNGSNAVFREGMTTEEYLSENSESIAVHIDKYMTPKYDGTHFVRAIGETKRVSLPAQARLVMGSLTVLKENNSAFMVGDMGTGKSQMALTTAYALLRQYEQNGLNEGIRVLIVAPAITIPKWAGSEILDILDASVAKTTVLNSTEDALAYVRKVKGGYKPKKGTIEFVLVSTDRMKLGPNKYVLGAKWNHHNNTWDCPDCGNPITSPAATKDDRDLLAGWGEAVESPELPPSLGEIKAAMSAKELLPNGLPENYVKRWTSKIRRFVCENCCKGSVKSKEEDITSRENNISVGELQKNHSLVRPALKNRGEDRVRPRWMIAQILQRALPKHFHLGIYDEIQMFKANDSGRGLSFHKLLKSTRKNLFLTGTLTNGEASSIKATLWRSDSNSLLDEGFTHSSSDVAWAKKYGVLEEVKFRNDEGVVGRTTNRRQARTILKIKPGISPQLTANHLLHKSVFLDLSELGLPLVKKEEIPVIIPLKDDHNLAYQGFHEELYETCMEMQNEMGAGAWSKFNPATLNYADQPHLGQDVVFQTVDEGILDVVRAPKFDKDYLTAKEEKLVEIIQKELSEDRGCIIYNHFTGQYQQNERLVEVLKRHGLDAEILDTKVSGDKRFDWLERQKNRGTKVLIMNMSLVQVGLDLLEWPTIIYYQLNDDINVLRQAGGRNWRIGQNRNSRIYFLVNQNTQQMAQFERLMTRRIEALLVEGRINRSDELAKFAKNNNSKLARDLSYSLEVSELEKKWITAAEKDVDQNIEMVDESELKERISEAFSRLTAETKRLCGVLVEEPQEKPNTKVVDDIQTNSVDQLDLFSFTDIIRAEVIPIKKKKGKVVQDSETVEQLAFII